jgi:hypothetical protein
MSRINATLRLQARRSLGAGVQRGIEARPGIIETGMVSGAISVFYPTGGPREQQGAMS